MLIFGAGAIGSLFGGLRSRNHEVTLVARPAHADAINRRGLRISGQTTFLAWPRAVTVAPAEEFDAVFVTTKAYGTAEAVVALRPFWRRSVLVTLQNGLGNAELIAESADHVLAGTTTHGVTFVAPGEIVHAGAGDTVVGPWKGVTVDDAKQIAGVLTSAGIPTAVSEDVRLELWAKAVVNSAINPLTAVLRRPNGELVHHEDLLTLLERVAREGSAAARASGVALDPDAMAAKATEVATRTAENRSSMLQDVEQGRRSEIEAITGALLKAGAAQGVRLPLSEVLRALIRGIERASPTHASESAQSWESPGKAI